MRYASNVRSVGVDRKVGESFSRGPECEGSIVSGLESGGNIDIGLERRRQLRERVICLQTCPLTIYFIKNIWLAC